MGRYVKLLLGVADDKVGTSKALVGSRVSLEIALIKPSKVVPSTMVCSPQMDETPLAHTMNERVLSSQRFELSSSRKTSARSLAVSGVASSRLIIKRHFSTVFTKSLLL